MEEELRRSRDELDHRRVQERTAQNQRLNAQLRAVLSRELRNPLAPVRNPL